MINLLITSLRTNPIETTAAILVILVILWAVIPFLQAYNRKGY